VNRNIKNHLKTAGLLFASFSVKGALLAIQSIHDAISEYSVTFVTEELKIQAGNIEPEPTDTKKVN